MGASRPRGSPKTPGSGRQSGTPNKVSKIARENLVAVFEALGGAPEMTVWAKDNPTEFYKLYARLLPVEHVGDGDGGAIPVKIVHEYVKP